MPNPFTESNTVQRPVIKYAAEIGWQIVSQKEAITYRNGEAGSLFYDILSSHLILLNPGVIDNKNVKDIVRRIENVRSSIEGNAEVISWMRGQRSVYLQSHKREINVKVIDFENVNNNIFQVTEEWQYTNGRFTNRADIVFLINGIPLAIIETKGAHLKNGAEKGFEQLRRYHNETPEMVSRPQLFNIPNILDFYYGVTWNLDRKNLFNWKSKEKENYEQKIKEYFNRERILKALNDYIVFFRKDDELHKIVLRQHQIRAVEKVIERALEGQKRRGLIWHTQGSGKTLTMITVAEELLHRTEFEKPTIIMLVDRNELESQLFQNLSSYGLEEGREIVITESKQHLHELLIADYRGIIISLIQKFDNLPQNVNLRENTFILVDEAHRTTSGDLGNYLFGALPNAMYVGFTGTPIDRISYGKGTFKVFGKDDERGYLDKYSIAESIEDGTTVPLHYTLAPNDIRVPKDLLEKEFLGLTEAEGISDIEELNRILDRAVKLKTFLKSDDRIKNVSEFVAKHFRDNVEPLGYKSFLVGVDREACVLYKLALDKLLPSDYSKVVMSQSHNDDQILKDQYLTENEEKQIRKAFTKHDQMPKILIVTEKLLTGFDAPILYSLYLDKPMRDHTLLQAIARVNRPYEDEIERHKPSGLVIDFIGVFDNLQKALSFDSDIVASVIQNIDTLKAYFEKLMLENAIEYLKLTDGSVDDKTIERIIDRFSDREYRDKFFSFFKEVEMLYEIISPDAYLRPYLDQYSNLAVLYSIVSNAFSTNVIITRDLMTKTEDLVKNNTSVEGLKKIMPVQNLDSQALLAIRKEDVSDNVKIINLSHTLMKKTKDNEADQPHLIPIGERARSILEYYDDRQISTQDALKELEKLVDKFNRANREMQEKGFDANIYSIYLVIQSHTNDADDLAIQINNLIIKFPNYKQNNMELRKLKTEIYKTLFDHDIKDISLSKKIVDSIIRLKRKQ